MLKTPILAIFRGIKIDHVQDLTKCCINAGIDTIEVTMNTDNVESIIEEFIKVSEGVLTVGAGTVLTVDDYKKAYDAGAKFIVTPVVNLEVINQCKINGLPVFPGALTPTEVYQAWSVGAEMVKVFPAGAFGPKYIKDLLGPLDEVKLMTVGGVNAKNIKEYFNNGASSVAIGGSIFNEERLRNENFKEIEADLKSLVDIWKEKT